MTSFLCLAFVILAAAWLVYRAVSRLVLRVAKGIAIDIDDTYRGLSEELDVTDELIRDTQKQVKQVFDSGYCHRDTIVGTIMSLGSEFRQEAAKLTEHTESLKAHGQALLDKAYVDQTNPRRVVTR